MQLLRLLLESIIRIATHDATGLLQAALKSAPANSVFQTAYAEHVVAEVTRELDSQEGNKGLRVSRYVYPMHILPFSLTLVSCLPFSCYLHRVLVLVLTSQLHNSIMLTPLRISAGC